MARRLGLPALLALGAGLMSGCGPSLPRLPATALRLDQASHIDKVASAAILVPRPLL